MPGIPWTEQEDNMLKAHYHLGPKYLAGQLNRTRKSIQWRASVLGLCVEHRRWTDEEEETLRREYPKGDYAGLAKLLKRSEASINLHASLLGVRISSEVVASKISLRVGRGEENGRFKGKGRVSGSYLAFLKTRGHDCSVTVDYLDSIAVDYCPLSGRLLIFKTHCGVMDATASLDRIDSSKGYIEGNVRWIHKDVNRMKWDMNDEEFLGWIAAVHTYCKGALTPSSRFVSGAQPIYYPPIFGRKKYNGYGRILGTQLNHMRSSAKERKLSYPLLEQREGIVYLDSIIPDVCPFSGRALTFPSSSTQKFTSASLDRIDSSLGYVEGNVRWIHRVVNKMKMDHSDAQYLGFVNDIAKHCSL